VGLITSGITAFYMFRLYFSIFWNKPSFAKASADKPNFDKSTVGKPAFATAGTEREFAILFPLIVLAIGAAFAGFIPFGKFVSSDGVPLDIDFHLKFSLAPIALSISGILIAINLY